MQKFLECTLASNYIKYLMMVTHLPKCTFISDGDLMLENNYYLYRGNIYYCNTAGIFRGGKAESYSPTYCSDGVICGSYQHHTDDMHSPHRCGEDCVIEVSDSETLFGQSAFAKFSTVSNYSEGEQIDGITDTFMSNRAAYDSDTHARLGEYLRMLKSQYGLNLMSMYNCYNGKFVDNVSVAFDSDDISSIYLSDDSSDRQKVTLIPIKFNRKYTVALTSHMPIYIAPVLYDGHLLRDSKKNFLLSSSNTIQKIGACTSSKPITFEVRNDNPTVGQHERSLYLMISMSKTIETPIIVLEGEYTLSTACADYITDASMFRRSNFEDMERAMSGSCSLLRISNGKIADTPAFADKLIGYLLEHYIDQRDPIYENIGRVISDIGYTAGEDKGWNNHLRNKIYHAYMKYKDIIPDRNYDDILGYVDSDIERAIMRGELYIGK